MTVSRVQTRPTPALNRSTIQAIALSVLLVAGGIYSARASAQAATDPGETKPAASASSPKSYQGTMYQGRADQMMRRMDTDKDGSVSKAELQAAQQKQLEMFDRADANKDGKLSADERKAFYETMRAEHRAKRG
jgi:Ca2+-binding EF-hand superfamily protein